MCLVQISSSDGCSFSNIGSSARGCGLHEVMRTGDNVRGSVRKVRLQGDEKRFIGILARPW